ncbi:hypothetical protein IJG66_00495 [Candidatus Saccharibacteria bacterium]|nr:hypothetical protein [Candidatus Saccharibacteria bacterium]
MKSLMTELWEFITALDLQTHMDWIPNTDDLEAVLEQDRELITTYGKAEADLLADVSGLALCIYWSNGQNSLLVGLNGQWIHLFSLDGAFTENKRKALRGWERLEFISSISGATLQDRTYAEELYEFLTPDEAAQKNQKATPPSIGAWHKDL